VTEPTRVSVPSDLAAASNVPESVATAPSSASASPGASRTSDSVPLASVRRVQGVPTRTIQRGAASPVAIDDTRAIELVKRLSLSWLWGRRVRRATCVPGSVRVPSDEVVVQPDGIFEPMLPHGMLDVLSGPLEWELGSVDADDRQVGLVQLVHSA
jgi:hypothetical protein